LRSQPRPDLSAVAWTDADIGRFLAVQGRLLRWGWPESEAEATAARIVRARREGDDRRACAECDHYRAASHRCARHHAAGLGAAPEVARDFAVLPQRCPAFSETAP
jgi:hypothetical protein